MAISCVLIALAFGVAHLMADPVVPTMPSQFSVTIEATLTQLNQTLNLREWNDGVAKKARYEIQSGPTQMTSFIVNWVTNQVWTVVNLQQCQASTFDLTADRFGYLPPGYLGLEALSRFNTSFGDTYMGQSYIRGVLCDGWQTSWSYPGGGRLRTDLTIQFWWSVPSWGRQFTFRNLSRPMRAMLNGTRTFNVSDGNGTFSLRTEIIDNDYEFVDFVIGPILPAYFELPDPCLPVHEAVLRYVLQTQQGGGLAAGMFFLGLVVGVVLWVLISLCYRKYREKQGWKWQSMQNSDAPNRDRDEPMSSDI